MYENLLEAIDHIPEVYESTGLAFWDDEHISQMMLENHLSADADGATRKHSFVKESVDWLASLPTPGNRLIDLGCGPGIYAELLAQGGCAVTGIDISKRSIKYAKDSARVKGFGIEYRCGDYLKVDLGDDAFDMATMIYCDYGVLPQADRKRLLEKAFRSLHPGGLFVVDAFSSFFRKDYTDNLEVEYEEDGFWSKDPYMVVTRNKTYPQRHYLERYVVVTKADCRAYNIWNHAFLAGELVGELEDAGFEHVELYADAAGRNYDETSETMCAVARKP